MKNKLNIFSLISCLLFFIGCDSFLDKMPDERAEVNSIDKVGQLLIAAYGDGSPILMTELSSDNAVDNGPLYSYYQRIEEEVYLWKDITTTDQDSPQYLWNSCYMAIAAANHALEALQNLPETKVSLAQKGEALMCRAYQHFILVNVFCQHYSKEYGATDLGIPYVEAPEKEVSVQYDRITVKEVYEKIERDILEALPLINDEYYNVPKYHFNQKSAYAFATRFFLFYEKYDKVIEYAEYVLGTNPKMVLRDYVGDDKLRDVEARWNLYIKDDLNCNLLIIPAKSAWAYVHGPYSIGKRYGHSKALVTTETLRAPGPWGSERLPAYGALWGFDQKMAYPKLGAFFEYTDKVAGIGYINLVDVPFTTDKVLVERAEAYIMLKNYSAAVADLSLWVENHGGSAITQEQFEAFYSVAPAALRKELTPLFTIEEGTQSNLIHALLHIRRMETIHEGSRWYDNKRFGIAVVHNIVGSDPITLAPRDPRMALQLPSSVISAGMTPNPR